MADLAIIKIHDDAGCGLVLNCTDSSCDRVYELIAARIDGELTLIDVSNFINPLEVMKEQSKATDTLFCLKTYNFHPGNKDDVERWLSDQDIPDEILKYCGDLWVAVDLDRVHDNDAN